MAGVMTTICWQVYARLKNEATVLEVKFRLGEYSAGTRNLEAKKLVQTSQVLGSKSGSIDT